MNDETDHWSITSPAAWVLGMTHGPTRSIASNNYISGHPLLGVRKWCKMVQMERQGLILTQQIAVKDLESLGNVFEKGWFVRL